MRKIRPISASLCAAFAIAAGLAATTTSAHAAAVLAGFNNLGSLAACDDCYSSTGVNMGFTADFFGTSYSQAYVSNNGYITFGGGQGNYSPTGLTAAYVGRPIIAAFLADVDTRSTGSVSYGTGTVNGHNAFGVTWTNVGYYANGSNKTNTFQIVLADRSDVAAGNFDILLNYDAINWETGSADGGINGLGGRSAAAGYANGTGLAGTYDQLRGSLVNGAFLNGGANGLVGNSFQFAVRTEGVSAIVPNEVPEPGSLLLACAALAGAGVAMRKRRTA